MFYSRSKLSFPALMLRSAITVSAIASIYLLQQVNEGNTTKQQAQADILSALPALTFLR